MIIYANQYNPISQNSSQLQPKPHHPFPLTPPIVFNTSCHTSFHTSQNNQCPSQEPHQRHKTPHMISIRSTRKLRRRTRRRIRGAHLNRGNLERRIRGRCSSNDTRARNRSRRGRCGSRRPPFRRLRARGRRRSSSICVRMFHA